MLKSNSGFSVQDSDARTKIANSFKENAFESRKLLIATLMDVIFTVAMTKLNVAAN